jgi:O-antigen/teichoic acid export membrane protein
MSLPATSAELDTSFRRGFAAAFTSDLIGKAAAAATLVILIRGLSVSSYAYATLCLAFAQFAASAAGGGVRTRYLREEAERTSRAIRGTPEISFLDPVLKGMLLVVAFGLCAASVAWATGFASALRGVTLIVFATGLAASLSAVELAVAHYQARRRFFTAGWLMVLRTFALLGAAVGIVLTRQSAFFIGLWLVGSMVAVALVTAGPIAWRSHFAHTRSKRISWFKREEMWLSLYYLAASAFAFVDIAVAAALLSDDEVATLGASLRYLAIILAALPALGAVLRVRTSQADVIDDRTNQRALVLNWIRRALLPAALIVGSTVVLAPVAVPRIDGGQYPGSIVVLQIFLVVAFAAYLMEPGVNVLMAQRQYAFLVCTYALGLVINLLGDIIVARTFGLAGIAIVSSAVYVGIGIATLVRTLSMASAREGSRNLPVAG